MRVLFVFLLVGLMVGCGDDATKEVSANSIDLNQTSVRMGCSYSGNISKASELCNFYGGRSFNSDSEAELALQKIMNVTGMSNNFVLSHCDDISNCVATSYQGIRYIVYDRAFMSAVSNRTNNWSKIAILAHEIGHHINGHSLDLVLYASGSVNPPTLRESRRMEIEADEFSGFVLSKMGANLSQAQEAIALISSYADDTYSTHPSKDKRLAAIERGYNNGKSNSSGKVYRKNSQDLTAQDYFYKAYNSEDADYTLNCYTKCLSLDAEYGGAATYNNRGNAYDDLGRYQDAIRDYNRALSIDPDYAIAYNNRGNAKRQLGRYQDAIRDYTRALSIDPDYAIAYNNRGNAYDDLGRYQDAIRDYNIALSIDPDYAIAYYNRGIAYDDLGRYQDAIRDYNIALSIDPDYAIAYYNRGIAYGELGRYQDAIRDYTRALSIDPDDASAYYNRGLAKRQLGRYQDAIRDYTRALSIDPDDASAYNNRGFAKGKLGIYKCDDYLKACQLGNQVGCDNYSNSCTD